jgi:transcriptional regulator
MYNPMYNPPYNRVDDRDDVFDLIERARFGHVVSHDSTGFAATSVPLLLDRGTGEHGALRGHLALANDQWRHLDGADVMVLFPLADGYVSPAWYPSKAEHGRVVPTWNYEVVHVHGTTLVHDDVDWVRGLVTDLTEHHESARTDDLAPAWSVDDAPPDFVDRQLRAIVGVEIRISHIDAKRKLSQNRTAEDRQGVMAGLGSSARDADHTLASAMRPAD